MARGKLLEKSRDSKVDRNQETERKVQTDTPRRRSGPRVVEDITILPPRAPPSPPRPEETDKGWTRVVNRKTRSKLQNRKGTNTNEDQKTQGTPKNAARPPPQKRPPRSAAISIKVGESISYADALRKIKQETVLTEYGIQNVRIRKAANQSTILEVSGADNAAKADALANRIQEVLENSAKVARPTKRADLRIIGFDESVLPEEIECAISEVGNCKISEVRVGRITPARNGTFIVTVSCPLSAAIGVSNLGKIKIGWTVSKAVLLKPRPIQCFRCWHFGHASYNCKSQVSRAGACFNCGSPEHLAQACRASPRCVICQERGFQPAHRMGTNGCRSRLLGSSGAANRRTADQQKDQLND